jgi:ubiquinone/menaquinone biosynthesis C-methylase UbiE
VTGLDVSPDMLAEARRKDPGMTLLLGSIVALPFPALHFGTAVCTRLLNWLRPPDMIRAIRELLRVAREVVCSIRLGLEREWGTYTHDRATFLGACDGALLDAEIELHPDSGHGRYSMIRLRRPTWADVVAQFAGHRGEPNLLRLAAEWADRYRVPHEDYRTVPVRAEWWSQEQLRAVLAGAATVEPRVWADGQPNLGQRPQRRDHGPLTFIRFGERYGILDGRHRAHRWMQTAGCYPVLVLECSKS